MAAIGIDLGTTNTVVAAVRDGRATALKDKLGRTLLPSVVSFSGEGAPLVGYSAKAKRSVDPENTVFSVKRLIGRSWESEHVQKARGRFPFELKEGPGKATLVSCRGSDYTLPEISANVLEAARAIAEERLGETVSDVVITVPANFNDLQRAATKVAARVAGLEVLRILNEPTAAALAYGFGKKGREKIAVYDFGGGTFDVTLLDLSENVFEVLATAGDTFLGGDDLDLAIVDRMAEELYKKHQVDANKNLHVREQLRLEAEKLKMDLSTRSMAKAVIGDLGHGTLGRSLTFEFSMRRSDFELLAEPLVNRTLDVCQEALNIAGLSVKDLDQVLLVGGSTRVPLVRRRISSYFGKMPQSRVNPDEVVAIGAAIQASALEGRSASMASISGEGTGTQRPQARPSQFPSSPNIQARTPGTTQTGLAGLKKTAPGTGAKGPSLDSPSAAVRTEGSVLSGLPKTSPSPVGGRMRVNTLSGLGSSPPPADVPGEESADRGPRTLMGVGEGSENELPAAREKMKTLSGTGDPKAAAPPAPNPLKFATLSGTGDPKSPSPMSPSPKKFSTLTGVGPDEAAPLAKKQGAFDRTLSGQGPSADLGPLPTVPSPTGFERKRVATIPGVSDNSITTGSTLAKLGVSDSKLTSHSTLARLGALGAPPVITESEAPPAVAPAPPSADDFEEITSIFPDMAAEAARLRDSHVEVSEPMFPTSDEPPVAPTKDGSVVFDFADLHEDSTMSVTPEEIEEEIADLPASIRPRIESDHFTADEEEEITDLPASLEPNDLPVLHPKSEPPPGLPLVGAGTGTGRTSPFGSPKETSSPLAKTNPLGRAAIAAAKAKEDEVEELSISEIDLNAMGALAAEASLPVPSAQTGLPKLASTQVGTGLPAALGTGLPQTTARAGAGLPAARAEVPDRRAAGLDRTMLAPEKVNPAAPVSLLDDFSDASEVDDLLGGGPAARGGITQGGIDKHVPAAGFLDQTRRAPVVEEPPVRRPSSRPPSYAPPVHTEGVRPPLLLDVTPLSLSVETVGGYTDRLIERNSPIPCERTRTFRTTGHNQTTVRVRVCQGETNRFVENTVLGEVELSGITPGVQGGAKVDVTFTLDESGMLQVTALDQTSGRRAKALLYLVGVQSH